MNEYIYKKVDYYSMRQLSDVIDELRSEYRIIGYRAYAQEQYAILTLYPIEQEGKEKPNDIQNIIKRRKEQRSIPSVQISNRKSVQR
jgi:hypothetical protein